MKKLTCFIASAFGQNDVDAIFKKAITPVLRQRGITPFRVDRVEHNDDIDDKILALIKTCDFCIADLTFARPSVYYEAGLVHGMNKPVIFLARADHFKPKKDDSSDNLRVHFDLQMKNIIKWTGPTATFRKQLGSRVNVVTKPLLVSLLKDEMQKQAQVDFSRLTQQKKFMTIFETAERELKKNGFRLDKKEVDREWGKSRVIGIKETRRATVLFCCLAQASFTKNDLKGIRQFPQSTKCASDCLKVDPNKSCIGHVFCCSLRPMPKSRIGDVLPYFSPNPSHKVYSYSRKVRSSVSDIVHIHFLDGIDSVLAAQNQLKTHLPLVGKLDN